LLQIKGKTLIGWAYLEMGQTKEALNRHLAAFRTTTDTVLLQKYSILFANLALNYNGLGKTDSAFYFIDKAVRYSRTNENLFALSNSLAIQAQLYVLSGQNKKAEQPLKEVVEIRKLIGDPFYIVSDMSQLAMYYARNGQPEKGIDLCKKGIAIANQFHLDTKLFFLYGTLADNYKALGDEVNYAKTLEKIIVLKDSVYQANSAHSLAEMQTKYELQKKENIIIQQKLGLIEKNYFIYGSLILLLLSLISGFLIFKGFRKRQQLKMQLMQEEEKRLSAQAVTAAEETERKRIAADLHDNLGAYAASIASNIDYLKIAQTDKQNATALKELQNNSQSMVAQLSDTIWALKKDAYPLTAISDRVKIFIQKIQSSYPDIIIDVIEEIPTDHVLSPAQAFHLFQTMQEGIINALRHSGAKHVTVIIGGDEHWRVSINDDGKGFSQNSIVSGSGLYNMKARSKEAGWNIHWQQNNGNGTSVIITSTAN